MTTDADVEAHLRSMLDAVARGVDPGLPPGIDEIDGEAADGHRSSLHLVVRRPTDRRHPDRRLPGRPGRWRSVAAAAVVVAASAGVAVAVVRSDGPDGATTGGPSPTTAVPDHDLTVPVGDTQVRVPAELDGFGPPVQAGDSTGNPPAVVYHESPTVPAGDRITVRVHRTPDAYTSLAARRLPAPGLGAAPDRGLDVGDRWIAVTPTETTDDGRTLDTVQFAVGDFTVVQIDVLGAGQGRALALADLIVAPPLTDRFVLPCRGTTVVEHLADLTLPDDLRTIPQRGRTGSGTAGGTCARVVRSTLGAARYVAFVDDLDTRLAPVHSVGAAPGRIVGWAEVDDAVHAVVADAAGGSFGVIASGLSPTQWEALATSLAYPSSPPPSP